MAKIKAKGCVLKYGDTASPSTTIPQHVDVSLDLGAWDRTDITSHDTVGLVKNYDTTLKEPATIEVRAFFDPADTAHAWLITAHAAGTTKYITIVIPDPGTAQWALTGHVSNLSIGGLTPSGHIEANFTFSASVIETFTA